MGTLDQLAAHLVLAITPLKEAVSGTDKFRQFIYRLGWNAQGLPPSYMNLIAKVDAAILLMESMGESPEITQIIDLFKKIKEIYNDIRNLTDAPPGVDAATFLNEIKDHLFEILIVDYLSAGFPIGYNLFRMTGIIQPIHFDSAPGRPSFIRHKLNWDEFPKLFTEPDKIPEKIFGWGTDDFRFNLLADYLLEFFHAIGTPTNISTVNDESAYKYLGFLEDDPFNPIVDTAIVIPFFYINIDGFDRELGLAILGLPKVGTKKPGIIIQPAIPSQIGTTLRIREDIEFRVKAGSNIASLFGILIRPDEISVEYPFKDGSLPDFGFGAGIDFKPVNPVVILGSAEATRLQFQGAAIDFAFNLTASKPEVIFGSDLKGLAIVLKAGEGDSFLQKILGDGEVKVDIPLGLEWSSVYGVKFKGGAGFEVALHPHFSLGPISFEEIQIAVKGEITDPPVIKLAVGTSIKGDLSVLQFVVEGIGISLDMVFTSGGNAGPFDIKLGFKPPNGIGLSVDASVVKGGGYLFFDFEKQEYAGALELTIQDTISLKAIGILTTLMPDGSKGFSLLILITAEFTPIQLGYGFTLIGVGGLLGVNRTVLVEELRLGVKDNSVKSIMFPEDVIANITRIISDLKRIFPSYQNHFIIGPMGKLGWGTPTLISLELGIIIDIPNPLVAILGVLKMVLPTEDTAVLRMQVNFLGVIDFNRKEISFDASLYNSRLLAFTLTGDMALRINWSENPVFVLSVGGFHPDFKEIPAGLTNMKRLSISLLSGDNPRIAVEMYFAVTSNTVQLGAKAELYAKGGGFNVYGYLGFDCLFRFDPFYFIVNVYAGLALRKGNNVLFGVQLSGQLSGPTPWNAQGKASFRIIFKFSVSFDKTWGETAEETVKELADIYEELKTALSDDRNWIAEIPQGNSLSVTMKKIELPEGQIVIHPFGVLSVSQKVVPLELQINKYGNKIPKDQNKFVINSIKSNTTDFPTDNVEDDFAPANFLELSDSQKLSRKSYEKFKSGKKLTATSALVSGTPVEKSVDYELSYMRRKVYQLLVAGIYNFSKQLFMFATKGSASYKASVSYTSNKASANSPKNVMVDTGKYAIAKTDDMTLYDAGMVTSSQTEAVEMMKQMIKNDPKLKGTIQVVQQYELNIL